MNIKECTFGIVGLGLMGGAIALSLRDNCGIRVNNILACDLNGAILDEARESGVIAQGWQADKAGEMLSRCDVVFLCLNPSVILRFLEQWGSAFKSGCIITDIAGTKSNIAAAAEQFRGDVDFIPGHPMAGAHVRFSGKSGFANAKLCNFIGKNYILTPLSRNKKENLDFLKNLIHKMGFICITEVTPAEHDRKIAFTSQLCHVIAASLIDCEGDTKVTRFGGGSFEDLTRIAMLNAPMWTELFIENSAPLLDCIERFEQCLDNLKTLITKAEAAELETKLTLVHDRRAAMNDDFL
jgi:prephenate dehydrogenase